MRLWNAVAAVVLVACVFGQEPPGKITSLLNKVRIDHIVIKWRPLTRTRPFTEAQLGEIKSKYEGKDISAEELVALCRELTQEFVDAGYLTSGAVIEDQPVNGRTLTVTIVLGDPPNVAVANNHVLRGSFYRDRLSCDPGTTFRQPDLESRLQQLHLNPQIRRFDAVLKPGDGPGASQLDIRVEENFLVNFGLQFDNYVSPVVGGNEIIGSASSGLLGNGDRITVALGRAPGLWPLVNAEYVYPLDRHDTTVRVAFRTNEFAAIQAVFRALDISNKSEIATIGIRRPVYRRNIADKDGTGRSTRELAIGIDAERLQNSAYLLGEPFSFSPGAVNGKYTITAVRLNQEFTQLSHGRVFAIRSRFSFGVNLLGSTIHSDEAGSPSAVYPGYRIPDSRFVSWQGQVQWSRRLRVLGFDQAEFIARGQGQLADHGLLALEQMPIGGRFSVRGFRENEFVRDQGFTSSFELRLPVLTNRLWTERLELAQFFDQGFGADRGLPASDWHALGSYGIGVRWMMKGEQHLKGIKPAFEIYWGFARYNRNPVEANSLQDHGVHFQLSLSGPR